MSFAGFNMWGGHQVMPYMTSTGVVKVAYLNVENLGEGFKEIKKIESEPTFLHWLGDLTEWEKYGKITDYIAKL